MRWLLILLLLACPVFGLTDADKAEMNEAADRAMEITNAELAEEIAELELSRQDMLRFGLHLQTIMKMDSVFQVVLRKVERQRHPYRWLKPKSVEGFYADRLPHNSDIMDRMVELKLTWKPVSISMMYEYEDSEYYYGYSLTGEHGLFYGFDIHVRTNIKTAKDIDRQSVVIGRRFERRTGFFEGAWGGIGGGAVTRHYSKPKGAVDFSIGLPGGQLIFTTDFKGIHIWDAETTFGIILTESTILTLTYQYFRDRDKRFKATKIGVKVDLE